MNLLIKFNHPRVGPQFENGEADSIPDVWIHPKSDISYSGRISISLGPGMGLGQRFTQATASSISLTSQSQKPVTISRGWGKGPSITVRLGPSNAIRLPCEDGVRPSQFPSFMMPAFTSSSLNLPMDSNHIPRLGRRDKALFAVFGSLH